MHHVSKIAALMCFALSSSSAVASQLEDNKKQLLNIPSNAKVSVDTNTGNARFMQLSPSTQVSALSAPLTIQNATDSGLDFLRTYGSSFGVKDVSTELLTMGTKADASGSQHSVFKQVYLGLPVFGGELRVHHNRNGQMIAVNGNFLSDIKISTQPKISPELAAKIAIIRVARDPAKSIDSVTAGDKEQILAGTSGFTTPTTTLMIFREGLLKGVPGNDRLVYEVEVGHSAGNVREFVYIDAMNNQVVDQITGIHDALDRRAYDAESAAHPGPNYPASPFWVEGDALPTTSVEADNMILASSETYSFFDNAFGRDSFDGSGATMDAIFNRGDGCPNASWNGIYISFCPGLTSDDITAHEWAHAYTEYTNNLIYQWQSGALNESYSDIWGETVDRINARDDLAAPDVARSNDSCSIYGSGAPSVDDSVRWLMGEDSTGFGGAIRDMWNPTCFGDPGKVSDTEYFCGTGDQGGVHSNSGVPNHAYALMVDGGSHNGETVAGLGLTKSAHIHWVAQNMLTPSSNFQDHADALETSCSSLIGVDLTNLSDGTPTGEVITAGNCAEVATIIDAVELRLAPSQCGFEPLLVADAPALCEGIGTKQTFFSEDFENGALPAGWSVSVHDVADAGTFDSPGWEVVDSLPENALGNFAAFAPDLVAGNCIEDTEAGAIALDSPVIALPAGEIPRVAFDHWVASEATWDGGNLKISVNGGAFTLVPAAAYSFNAYNGVLAAGDNPLAGEEAFTGSDGGENSGSWGQSQVNLLGLAVAGDNIQLRFDFGTDGCNGLFGWYVDSIEAYSCSDDVLPVCGDGEAAIGEQCDDGNGVNGDGCSSTCQVESGFVCTSPTEPSSSSNVVADWSFEGGFPNVDWTPSSSFGGVPGFPLCATANGCAEVTATGVWSVLIGGITGGVTSNIAQDIMIPTSATELTMKTLRGICAASDDTVDVTIDGNVIGSVVCDGTDGDFVEQSFPVAPYNDGNVHTLNIGGTVGNEASNSNFFVDDVTIEDNVARPGMPSVCTEVEPGLTDLVCNAGEVTFDEGIPNSWSVIDNAGLGIIWTNINDSGIGGNYTGGEGDAASMSSDANPGAFDAELRSNSFSLADMTSANIEYLVNYQNFAAFDFLNLDVSIDGGNNWDTLLSWNEDHPVGGLFVAPGEAVSVDLSAYTGETNVQLRWHYFDPNEGDDFDWYAQVDNVGLVCNDDPVAMQCDIDNNGVVDRSDLGLIGAARNQPAVPGDPRDNDGNGVINISDVRQCTALCTLPRCATPL